VTVGIGLWQSLAAANNGGGTSLWSLIIIGSLVSIIPLVIAFLSLQRYWQGGLSLGSLK
jgi:multiple sugar transport system permease protein